MVLIVGMLLGVPTAAVGQQVFGDVGLWLVLVPIVLALPLPLPWFDPPAEHGAVQLARYVAQKVWRNCTWTRYVAQKVWRNCTWTR